MPSTNHADARTARGPQEPAGRRRSLVSMARTAGPSGSTAAPRGFTVRWGRTCLALIAALALLTALITGVAAAFGAGTGAVAGISLLIAVAGIAALRALALRERKRRRDRRIEAAFAEAGDPGGAVTGPSTVFDAAASADPPEQAQDTSAQDARSQQMSVQQATGQQATGQQAPGQHTSGQAAPADQDRTSTAPAAPFAVNRPSDVVMPAVPRPTYLDAPEAVRPEPEPLDLPATPAAAPGTTLKSGVSAEYSAQVQATAHRTLDLDKVLERRRAV